MNEELLQDIIAKLIPDDAITAAIDRAVREKMDYHMERAIREEAERITSELGGEYIREKIEDLISKPVRIDDGWGNGEEIGSFEDLIKRRMNDVFRKGQWDFESKLRGIVTDKIKKYCERVIEKHKQDDYIDETLELIYEDLKDKGDK